MRLEQGQGGACSTAGQSQTQPRLGRHVDRRQPLDPRLAGGPAQGRRDRAPDAGRRRRRRVERRRLRVPRRERRRHPRSERSHGELRQHRAGGGAGAAAAKCHPEGPEGLEADRHAEEAPRDHRQDSGQADLWHRRAPARHAACRGDPIAGVQRKAQVGGRNEGGRHAGACAGSSSSTMRWRQSPTIGGRRGKRWRRSRSSGTRAATVKSRAPASRSSCVPGSLPTRPESVVVKGMSPRR